MKRRAELPGMRGLERIAGLSFCAHVGSDRQRARAVPSRLSDTRNWLSSGTVAASNGLTNVYLPDSWVLSVETTASSVCFVLDAVLQDEHPRFCWPPNPGQQHSYARLRWCLHGAVHWNEGPNLDRPAIDANDEVDYGHIDVWLQSGDRHMLEGDWGNVVIDRPAQTVEYLD